MPLTADRLHEYLAFAHRLADAAAAQSLPLFRAHADIEDKAAGAAGRRFDPVTVADKAAETAMRELIASTYPDHGVLGEEHAQVEGASPLTWVLDPIDGTRAFITGLPLWGTLIALHDGTRPVLGMMDQPFTRERFVGTGHAAWLGELPLCTRPCATLTEARLMCTTPEMFADAAEWRAFSGVARRARLVRYGGDCYAYCMVAAGHVDAVVEAGLQPYDVQALIPIIEGAGGIVTSWTGDDAQNGGRVVACGDRRLHAEILAALAA